MSSKFTKFKINIILPIALALTIFNSCDKNEDFLDKVAHTKGLAIEWLKENFREKGLWHYIYTPSKEQYSSSNNALRQLMASRLAAELAENNSQLKAIHRKNLDFIFENWYQEKNDLGYIYYSKKSKLGANAMLLRTLTFSPYFHQYQNEAKKTAQGIISLINEDGSFSPWFEAPSYEYDSDYLLTFYSGEALLALVDYYQRSKDEEILKMAIKAQDFYLEKYVKNLDANYYPSYVPWHTQSLNKLYKITGNPKYAEAIFILNDKVLELLDHTEYPGRFYNPKTPEYGTPHVASDGVYTEGLAYALEIAILTKDEAHEKNYRQAIELAFENLTRLQYCNHDQKIRNDKRICGAFQYRVGDDRIRIDNTQHAIDAMIKIEEIW